MKKRSSVNNHVEDIFKKLLTPIWLRPERALWDAHELFWVMDFLGKDFQRPSLEYGCIDGVLTSVILGGSFKDTFDDYINVAWKKDSYKKHNMLKSDYFDSFDQDKKVEDFFLKKPDSFFDYGVSWKESHIKKSAQMSVYKTLIRADLGEKLSMLSDGSIATIYAPNLFWIEKEKLDNSLKDLRRILNSDGRIITVFPDASQKDCLFYRFSNDQNRQWMDDLDRGMHLNLSRHAKSIEDWKEHFNSLGLKISRHENFIPTIVSEVYQIGFRPMFPVFMNIYNKLRSYSEEDWLDLKQHWIETVYYFLSPFCDTSWTDKRGMTKVWHIFELKKG